MTGRRPSGLAILLRGMLMGAADIVPGVSGGTIAFITGIYARLVAAISAFDIGLLRILLRGDWRAAWRAVDGGFLFSLVSGIAISVFTLARVITQLLETQPQPLWSFFFGLILASAAVLLRHVRHWSPGVVLAACAGTLTATGLSLSPAFDLPPTTLSFFGAGFVAICAMILPGISGSFILVLLGMYPRVLAAVENLEVVSLGGFALGAGCGLLTFSRLLRWLLTRFHAVTLATLTGFLAGSLPMVWPWKLAPAESLPARPVWPWDHAAAVGTSDLPLCLLFIGIGFVTVWLLESRWGGLER